VVAGPYGVAYGAGSIWVGSASRSSVTRIDPVRKRVLARIDVGSQPIGIAAAADTVWVAVFGEGTVAKIDPTTNTVVARISVGGTPETVVPALGALLGAE
jgi:YVTN family beta-propeller protein